MDSHVDDDNIEYVPLIGHYCTQNGVRGLILDAWRGDNGDIVCEVAWQPAGDTSWSTGYTKSTELLDSLNVD